MGCWGIWTVLYGCKGQLFPLSLWRNAGLSSALPHESSEGAGGGGRDDCDVAGSSNKKERKFLSPPPFCFFLFSFIASPFLPPGFDLGGGWGAGKSQQNFGLEKWLMTTFSSKSQWARQRRAWPKPQQCNWNYRASSRRKSCWTWLERHRERDGQIPP